MLVIRIEADAIRFGDGLAVTFQRTLRIPDDGKTYPLPPGLGRFPIASVADYQSRVPDGWSEEDVFIPMYQREAMWLGLDARYWKPNAVKIGVGRINAVSGKPWDEELRTGTNDYLVCPPQPWLDGINAGEGFIRQFVAMPLGLGYTVEAQIAGEERFGGVQIVVFEPRPGKFPDQPPPRREDPRVLSAVFDGALSFEAAGPKSVAGTEMGLAAGGKMRQKIYPDPHGIGTWDPDNTGRIVLHIVNSAMYQEITGKAPPPTPISAQTYTEHGLPWFDLYDEEMADIAAPDALKEVKSVKQLDEEKGAVQQEEDGGLGISGSQITTYPIGPEGIPPTGN